MGTFKERIKRNLFRFSTLLAAAVVFGLVGLNILTGLITFNIWDAQRLTWIFSIANGFNMYYHPASDGPVLVRIYAPLNAVIFYPATFLKTPTQALIFSSLLSCCYFSLPLLFLRGFRREVNIYRVATLVVFYGFVVSFFSLTYSAFAVHSDSLGLALCALACFFMMRTGGKGTSNLPLSMICAFLAVWMKQVFLPIVVVLPLFLFLLGEKQSFRKCLIILLLLSAVSMSLFLFIDIQSFLFEAFIVPSNHPWKYSDKGIALIYGLSDLFNQAMPFILFCAVAYFASQRTLPNEENSSFRVWLSKNNWFIFIITAIAMMPTCLMGWLKVGGDYNSFSYVQYFLLFCGIYLMDETLTRCLNSSNKALKVFLAIFMVSFALLCFPKLNDLSERFKQVAVNDHEAVYQYSKRNPGKAYFPNNPLSVLMSEKKFYHFLWGVREREMAGYPLTNQEFRAGIPKQFDYIIFPGNSRYEYQYIFEFLPEYSRRIELPEFPGGLVFSKE